MQFKIASLAKPFVATLILQLVGQGKSRSTTTSPSGSRARAGRRAGHPSEPERRRTSIVVVSTKIADAITPPPMFQALAMAVLGPHLGFGLTPAQALKPNNFG